MKRCVVAGSASRFDSGEDRAAAVTQTAIGQILGDDFLRQKGDA
ncbi:hypothetical protein [Mesorhizobium sp. AA22]|nr:hypothetical protein [Mesorhizobium sp. AA22]